MILYFSGTGNSRYMAKLLGEQIGDETEEMNRLVKRGEYPAFASERPYVFVTPVYAWRIPHVVEDFVRRCSFDGSKEAYFIMTCGDSIGSAAVYAKRLCEEKGFSYQGTADVIMPENFIAMFRTPAPEKCEEQIAAAEKKIYKIAEKINKREELNPEGKPMWFFSAIANPLFYFFCTTSKKFYVGENCNGCGICREVCPLNVISIENGKPVWGKDCTQCMACISSCPAETIEYGKNTQGKERYRLEKYRPFKMR